MTTEATPRRPMGRPTKYRAEYAAQARKLTDYGAIDSQLADFFEVTLRTINNWKITKPDFAEACKAGKAVADERVLGSLFSRAVGYSFDSEKVMTSNGRVFREPIVEHVPPDVKACVIWLTNRRGNEWRLNPKPAADGEGGIEADFLARIRADAPTLRPDEPGPASPVIL